MILLAQKKCNLVFNMAETNFYVFMHSLYWTWFYGLTSSAIQDVWLQIWFTVIEITSSFWMSSERMIWFLIMWKKHTLSTQYFRLYPCPTSPFLSMQSLDNIGWLCVAYAKQRYVGKISACTFNAQVLHRLASSP